MIAPLMALALGHAPAPAASPAPAWAVDLLPAQVAGDPVPPDLDDGLLDPAWFGPGVRFSADPEVDYVWVRPGLNLRGRSLQVKAWEGPVFLKRGRDRRDRAAADHFTSAFPPILGEALAAGLRSRCTLVEANPDYVLEGRFVDMNAGNPDLQAQVGWGAGAGSATWDLKLVDARTGVPVLAAHHRVIALTNRITLRDRLEEWAQTFAHFLFDTATK